MQRRRRVHGVPNIRRRAGSQEHLRRIHMTPGRRQVQRGVAASIRRCNGSPRFDETTHHERVPMLRGKVQRSATIAVPKAGVRPQIEQAGNECRMAAPSSQHQRRHAQGIDQIQLPLASLADRQRIDTTLQGRTMQRTTTLPHRSLEYGYHSLVQWRSRLPQHRQHSIPQHLRIPPRRYEKRVPSLGQLPWRTQGRARGQNR